MGAKLEVVLIDGGGDAGGSGGASADGGLRPGAPAAEPVQGPRADASGSAGAKVSQDAHSLLTERIKDLAKALGAGGLLTTVAEINRYASTLSALQGQGDAKGTKSQSATNAEAGKGASVSPQPMAGQASLPHGKSGAAGAGPKVTPEPSRPNPSQAGSDVATVRTGASAVKETIAAVPAAPAIQGAATAGGIAAGAAAATAGLVAVAGVAVAAVKALDMLGKTAAAESQRLAQYSSALSGAEARAELSEIQNDMRRAERIGPQLAGARDAQTRFEASMDDLKTTMLEKFLPILEAGLTTASVLVDLMHLQTKNTEILIDLANPVAWFTGELSKDLKQAKVIADRLVKTLTEDPDEPEFTEQFIEMFTGAGLEPRPRRVAPVAPPAAAN